MTSPSKKYRVVVFEGIPEIVVALGEDEADGPKLTWREAKKELRKWYLDQAKELRSVTEKSYFE